MRETYQLHSGGKCLEGGCVPRSDTQKLLLQPSKATQPDMFCCFVFLDDVHEKSTSHHLGNCQFLSPSSRALAAFPLGPPQPPLQSGHQQLLGEVWRCQACGRQILHLPTKKTVCFFITPHRKQKPFKGLRPDMDTDLLTSSFSIRIIECMGADCELHCF